MTRALKENEMLHYAIVFFIVALIAAVICWIVVFIVMLPLFAAAGIARMMAG